MSATEPELHQLEEHYVRKTRRTRLFFGAALIAAITVTAVLVLSLSGKTKSTAHPTALPNRSAVVATSSATPRTGAATAPPSPGSDADMSTVIFNGATLPVSKTSGPRVMKAGLASGFAETPLGAALAAVHIGYRLDPSVGAAVYTPTAQQQTIGDNAALIKELQSTPTTPDSGPDAEYVGYRIDDYSTTEVVSVHEEARQPGTDQRFDVPINVQWTGADWKVVLPLPNSTKSVADSSVFTSF